jgi:hypothetical protein
LALAGLKNETKTAALTESRARPASNQEWTMTEIGTCVMRRPANLGNFCATPTAKKKQAGEEIDEPRRGKILGDATRDRTKQWRQLRLENENETSDLEGASSHNKNEQHKARRKNNFFIEI